jgi:hypothetical protein
LNHRKYLAIRVDDQYDGLADLPGAMRNEMLLRIGKVNGSRSVFQLPGFCE